MQRKKLIKVMIAILSGLIAVVGLINISDIIQDNRIMEKSPLNNYAFYHSLDNFPRYKLEAAEMVEELVRNGTDEHEACLLAIDETSDKIYKDTLEFYSTQKNGWEVDEYNKEAELMKFMADKQK